ncbi:MAG: septal ring lytic transglycosylase RlpA family protein, partial [Algicola sp.]|nr:septal ring lytic transglycosylase RlpA family protein [Algicola sp.]
MLGGCVNSGRYDMKSDQAPLRKPTSLETNDAKPEYQPIYPWSIKPYTVRGKRYVPLKSAQDYQATGIASWYGRKFHGHKTANGEVYDMFAMTAAHKTLPIPSFVRVTNLDSQKVIIVRVNDRGPFHDHRVIDLSYSAAYALGMLNTVTA